MKKKIYCFLLLSKFTIGFICFQSRYSFILKFKIKLLGKTDLKGGVIFLCLSKGGMG
jgi:hypothetical protein